MSDEPIQGDPSTLAYLVRSLEHHKRNEEKVKRSRIEVEEKIAALVPGPEKGQKTIKTTDGYKVTVERGFNYRADCQFISKCCEELGLSIPVKSKTTLELDSTGYEWYRENDPKTFQLISQYVAVTPKKVSVTIKAPQ